MRDAKQWPQATAVAQEAVQKLPNDRGLKLVLAGQLADTGQADEGLAMAKSLLKGTPEDREVYIALAQINSRLKRWSEAEEDINKASGAGHQAGGQGLRPVRAGLDLRAAEEIRAGGSRLPEGAGQRSHAAP